jgi:hypothetical protein
MQSLQLLWLDEQGTNPSQAGAWAFEVALGQLQQLTSLMMASNDNLNAALAPMSSLSRLQDLDLGSIGTPEQPLHLQWLPSSLTTVCLSACQIALSADLMLMTAHSSG